MSLLNGLTALGRHFHFAWKVAFALPGALFRRPGSVSVQLSQIFVGALPLALAGGVAVGAVIWMHGRQPLRAVGGQEAARVLPQALALIVVLELAPIVAGLIVAGRSGASLAAELGSMRLTEQLDALEMLGVQPERELVGPRVLACVVALPLLTGFIMTTALAAGLAAEMLAGTMTPTQYHAAYVKAIELRDLVPSLSKTMVFGFLVGAAGCQAGLNATGGTEGVGRAATRGVVRSIFLVLLADVVLVLVIQKVLR